MILYRFFVNKRYKVIWKNCIRSKNWKLMSCLRLCFEYFVFFFGFIKEYLLLFIFYYKVFKIINVGGFCFNIVYVYVYKYKIIILYMCN